MRFRFLLVATLALLAGLTSEPALAVEVTVAGEPETVFSWKRDRCDDLWIPDSPARAYRRADGSVVLIAAHYTNGILAGPDLDRLKPDCRVSSGGREEADPAAFDDRYWVQALIPAGNGRVIAVGSHEYAGSRHPGRCAVATGPLPRCWYSALVLADAREDEFRFRLLPPERRLLAASPLPFDPDAKARSGFFTASNIVPRDGSLHLFAWQEIGGSRGNCLFRASADDPTRWTALAGGRFEASFKVPAAAVRADAAAGPARCDVVGAGTLLNVLRSVVLVEPLGLYLGVFAVGEAQRAAEGIYVSTSPNLVDWSPGRRVFSDPSPNDAAGCRAVYQYPSLIDAGSRSPIFATANGTELFLYLTRFNREACRRELDRDLIRMRLRIER